MIINEKNITGHEKTRNANTSVKQKTQRKATNTKNNIPDKKHSKNIEQENSKRKNSKERP